MYKNKMTGAGPICAVALPVKMLGPSPQSNQAANTVTMMCCRISTSPKLQEKTILRNPPRTKMTKYFEIAELSLAPMYHNGW